MERGLIKHFYKRPHADQILVTFGLAIIVQEIINYFGANPIPQSAPDIVAGCRQMSALGRASAKTMIYPVLAARLFLLSAIVIGGVFAFLQFTTFGMVVRAGMAGPRDCRTARHQHPAPFHHRLRIAAAVAGVAGAMYTPILPPDYHMGMDFLVLSFVVVVVGGMGSLSGAVAAGFLLGILQSFASMNEVKAILPGIDQIIIYLVAVIILLTLPRGLMGRKGVMED
jgi:branched-chain amino acid transport system permease protein